LKPSHSFKHWLHGFRVLIGLIMAFSQPGWTVSRSSAAPVSFHKYVGTYSVPATISGSAGIAGATISYTGGSTTADWVGRYSFTVPFGWVGMVTPSLPGYTFSPANRIYLNVMDDQPDQNYTATANPNHWNYLPLIMH
jgi:hypothetical protein